MERAGVACLFSPRGERGSSSIGPQFLRLESMSSFLFFRSSTETSFLLLLSSSLSFPLFLKFFNLFSELAEGILVTIKNQVKIWNDLALMKDYSVWFIFSQSLVSTLSPLSHGEHLKVLAVGPRLCQAEPSSF